MNIGEAVTAMKQNHRVRRAGWNGKGMHIYLEDDLESTIEGRNPRLRDGRMYHSYIVLLTAQGTFQPGWNASTLDLLADDWEIVP